MKFFIDTANLDQIREAKDFGVLDGVTTNPSLMAKEGIAGDKKVRAHYEAICKLVGEDCDVSAAKILPSATIPLYSVLITSALTSQSSPTSLHIAS